MPQKKPVIRKKKSVTDKIKDDQARGARRAIFEELFNDFYTNRAQVYKMNFFRGMFFTLGGIIGGTVVIAIVVSLLSYFDSIPFIGDYIKTTTESIEESTTR